MILPVPWMLVLETSSSYLVWYLLSISSSKLCVCDQERRWRDCMHAHARHSFLLAEAKCISSTKPQSAYMFVNPMMVYSYGFLFNCTTVSKASDLMTALRKTLIGWLVHTTCLWLGPSCLNLRFSLALTICESQALSLFHHSMLI